MDINRKEAARVFGVSEPTIDRWITLGCPVKEKGGHGVPYILDDDAMQAWREEVVAKAQAAAAAREEKLKALRGQLDLDLGASPDEEKNRLKYSKEYYETEAKRMDVDIRRGKLVRAADVEKAFLDLFGMLNERLQALPDYLERSAGLDAELTQIIADRVDEWQEELAKDAAAPLLGKSENDDRRAAG